MSVPAAPGPSTFRLLIVPGVTADRWIRTWSERVPGVELEVVPAEAHETAVLLDTGADAGLVRLPVDQDTVQAIPLYTEVTVVVVPREHVVAAADEVSIADLADETLLHPLDDVLSWPGVAVVPPSPGPDRPVTTAVAVEWVAAGAGVLVVPQSLARRYHRRDLTYRVVTDAPTSTVALAWVRERYSDLVEEMIGIVRGRTANSTRGRAPALGPSPAPTSTPTSTPAPGPSARTPSEPGTPRQNSEPGRPGRRQTGPNKRTSPRRRRG